MVGLDNVDNTSDADKPVSTATQTALDLKENLANKSTDIVIDALSDTKYPSVKSVKAYVDASADAKVTDAIVDAVITVAPSQNAVYDALALKADIASPTFTGTVSGIDKTMVGLGNVDNTSDTDKPVSTSTQTALDLKENLANKSTDIVIDALSDTKYPSVKSVKVYVDASADAKVTDAIVDAVITVAPSQNAVYDALALKADIASPTFTGTVSGIDKTMVGLGDVDNTSDADKPVSTATQTALDLKVDKVSGKGLSAEDYTTAEKTKLEAITGTNTGDQDLSSYATNTSLALKADIASPTFTGTVSGIDKTMVGLGNVDNTSDADKPVSTSTQTALDLKENLANKSTDIVIDALSDTKYPSVKSVKVYVDASADAKVTDAIVDAVITVAPSQNAVYDALALKADIASPTFTGTVSGIDKTMVGLDNVDNTSDADKPVSTATQTALDLKAPLASPTLTGTPLAPTATAGTSTQQIATTAFVTDAITTANTPDASATVKGKLQLAGDLSGTAALPSIANDAVTSAKIADGTIVNTDINSSAAIAFSKLNISKSDIEGLGIPGEDTDTTYSAGTGLTLTGTTLSIDSSVVTSNYLGTITTAGFIKSGGIASQFLKADGSVDATSYAPLASPTFTGTVSGIDKEMVGLDNVDNTSDTNKPVSTATQTALDLKVDKVSGERLINAAEITKLSNQSGTNTGDQDLSSYATNTNLALKANIASPTFTGTVSGIDKTMVGLGNVDNTSDANKPVSTATQTALDLKANLTSPSLLGTPIAPTATAGTNTTQIATTEFVTTATTGKFVDLTTNQTIAGIKTFNSDITVNGVKIGRGDGNNGENTAVGNGALGTGTGSRNSAFGNGALRSYSGTGFDNNTSVGYSNLPGLTTGSGNTSVGAESMMGLSIGTSNTSIGNQSLINTSGNNNVGVGKSSGSIITTGSNNTIIGTGANVATNNQTNSTAIGFQAVAAANNTIQLGNTNVTLVNTSGAITSGGGITGASIVKVGGTSSEYLMADGSVSTGASPVREVADEFTATASQSGFTLTQPPSANSKVKMYVNGIRISNTAYSTTGTTLTYVPANNGGYNLSLNDRIQFDYYY
jgi:hypothetical protein